jgi:S-adenosylmethionine hydrolase
VTAYRVIGFLTDYGLADAYVAVCHGVLDEIAPAARVIDVSHLVPPQDVARGARVLAQAAPYLAPAVLVAVVDPGVGGARRPVAVEAGGCLLVGPDNGLLLEAASALGGVNRAVVLDRPEFFRPSVSATFHGRDVFSPVAAYLFNGVALTELGSMIEPASLTSLAEPLLRHGEGWLETEVVSVDRFGNVQLGARRADLEALGLADGDLVRIAAARTTTATVGTTFGTVPPGEPVLLVDSDGHLAVAVNQGRAADVLGTRSGAVLRLDPRPPVAPRLQ